MPSPEDRAEIQFACVDLLRAQAALHRVQAVTSEDEGMPLMARAYAQLADAENRLADKLEKNAPI